MESQPLIYVTKLAALDAGTLRGEVIVLGDSTGVAALRPDALEPALPAGLARLESRAAGLGPRGGRVPAAPDPRRACRRAASAPRRAALLDAELHRVAPELRRVSAHAPAPARARAARRLGASATSATCSSGSPRGCRRSATARSSSRARSPCSSTAGRGSPMATGRSRGIRPTTRCSAGVTNSARSATIASRRRSSGSAAGTCSTRCACRRASSTPASATTAAPSTSRPSSRRRARNARCNACSICARRTRFRCWCCRRRSRGRSRRLSIWPAARSASTRSSARAFGARRGVAVPLGLRMPWPHRYFGDLAHLKEDGMQRYTQEILPSLRESAAAAQP